MKWGYIFIGLIVLAAVGLCGVAQITGGSHVPAVKMPLADLPQLVPISEALASKGGCTDYSDDSHNAHMTVCYPRGTDHSQYGWELMEAKRLFGNVLLVQFDDKKVYKGQKYVEVTFAPIRR